MPDGDGIPFPRGGGWSAVDTGHGRPSPYAVGGSLRTPGHLPKDRPAAPAVDLATARTAAPDQSPTRRQTTENTGLNTIPKNVTPPRQRGGQEGEAAGATSKVWETA